MSLEKVREYFSQYQLEERIHVFDHETATVEQAAKVLDIEPNQVAKTMAFNLKEGPIVIVTEGGARIANAKFKAAFGQKAKMVKPNELESVVGHPIGGVCPFALKPNVKVYLDQSLKQHEVVYPAAGSANSGIELTLAELEKYAQPAEWVDVTK
ncbi:YbaK/EbsC family protein [Lactobacillus sp. ESL0684]|uniref:YbaK/EbsC family protein n=1 Tax=Lactobacillus sp. ESL0684 TaxID=2983213 RepID=UPI0023F6ADA0|nr:YbaK/EbsC family protein [Lactobacillus sp. ESL0684]WEV43953.1 YbaK/EbsC family protein [Lactobacillus sp. ESL0684]